MALSAARASGAAFGAYLHRRFLVSGCEGGPGARGRSFGDNGLGDSVKLYSDLIVPFGRMVETDDFCTVISVPSAISTPT
ncbi:hypothetical protein C7410_12437 [Paraburkholderia silvatlantica]|uniref:Uncharacterized protein n=1 Tax=Paraburkholderia silvatlantica TaxID=321895 RepID=A0A2V4T390_9BURK|nr:hypothetical protein C7410_12437 [Paraburkholderia silvatlantica]TDQ86239.1 hypothetical protein C7412_11882 [Paraburkholderia silvatlantica]